jgi:hypothetical protein
MDLYTWIYGCDALAAKLDVQARRAMAPTFPTSIFFWNFSFTKKKPDDLVMECTKKTAKKCMSPRLPVLWCCPRKPHCSWESPDGEADLSKSAQQQAADGLIHAPQWLSVGPFASYTAIARAGIGRQGHIGRPRVCGSGCLRRWRK